MFINGLKEEFRQTLWLLKPACLLDIQSNARLISNDISPEHTRVGPNVGAGLPRMFQRGLVHFPNSRAQLGKEVLPTRNQGASPYNHRQGEGRSQPQQTVVRRLLTQDEVNERINKGLCFGCNDPYSREHMSSRKQLFSMVLESTERVGKACLKLYQRL